jgi:hypothetical protein
LAGAEICVFTDSKRSRHRLFALIHGNWSYGPDMRPIVVAVAAALLLMAGGTVALLGAKPSGVAPPNPSQLGDNQTVSKAIQLAFGELLDPGPKLMPSDKARSLVGKRVRMVGFMAELEEPLDGAFYLVARPIRLDESGAGTADLPLDGVLVVVPGADGQKIPYVAGALEGIGVLEVGNHTDAAGRVSNFRLRLEGELPTAQKRALPATASLQ